MIKIIIILVFCFSAYCEEKIIPVDAIPPYIIKDKTIDITVTKDRDLSSPLIISTSPLQKLGFISSQIRDMIIAPCDDMPYTIKLKINRNKTFYIRTEIDIRITNESFCGTIDASQTIMIRKYPRPDLFGAIDLHPNDIVEIVSNPEVLSASESNLYLVTPCILSR